MKDYAANKIRNFALVGHGSSGKTMLSEAMLLKSGEIKLRPTIINEKSNKDTLMCEMEKVLKRRMSLVNGL